MSGRLKVMTVVGTRPEIIRLARIIAELNETTEHTLVHTGQNWDANLNEIFFKDLALPMPDLQMGSDPSSLGSMLGDILRGTEKAIEQYKPDAVVVLGDTNSCISALMARRMKVPVYHLEAGNRSFDPNVPEEINRHLVDHVADYNLVYTEHSRRNLLAEGLHPSRVVLMGSPMREVIEYYQPQINASTVLNDLGLSSGNYILASTHREENVDREDRLTAVVESLAALATHFKCPVLVSTHPRTKKRLEQYGLQVNEAVRFHPPLGFHDYNNLQVNAKVVISDSGTISEESTILGFPAVTLRDAIERPEAIDTGAIITTGLNTEDVIDSVEITLSHWEKQGPTESPADYLIHNSSRRVVNLIRSTAATHNMRSGVRK